MQKLKLYIFILFIGLLSCNNGDERIIENSCAFQTIISADLYASAPNDPLSIIDLEINEDCLQITFSASGCDGNNWNFKLIDSGEIMESLPVQRNLRLSFENNEDCTAVPTKVVTFGISELQLPNENQIYLNITNS
ncbi:MAG: hypothetical protein NXH90_17790, partial [Flavobacteriaceae bacterium]|nr:hypothetical protein [Flavobacteriaceae bacterium]